jgi:cytokinesis protein
MSGHYLARGPAFAAAPGIGLPVVRPKKKLKALHWEKVDAPETSHWAAHTPSAEAREEKYQELSKKGILDEVEKLFMAKEIKKLGMGGASKKDDKKQIISSDLRKAYGKFIIVSYTSCVLTRCRNRLCQVLAICCRKGCSDDHSL